MQITREEAVSLFVALGLKNAAKWNSARMVNKLSKIKNMVDDDVESDLAERGLGADLVNLKAVLAANESDEDVEVVDDADDEETGTGDEQTGDVVETDSETTAGSEESSDSEPDVKKVRKPREKHPKEPKPARRTVCFVCGEVIGKRGLAVGVTNDMVDEVVAQVRTDDRARVGIDLRTAWHAVSGYVGFKHDGNVPGVNTGMETRPGTAGALIKERGIDLPVKDLVPVLNENYGRPNDTQSMFTLRNALGAIKGYESVAAETALAEEPEVASTEDPETEG